MKTKTIKTSGLTGILWIDGNPILSVSAKSIVWFNLKNNFETIVQFYSGKIPSLLVGCHTVDVNAKFDGDYAEVEFTVPANSPFKAYC
jgi:hypothetical protein